MLLRFAQLTYKAARRVVVAVVGLTVVAIGLIMIVTPGPAFVVIPLGLTILSIEFAWARHWLKKLRDGISQRTAQARAGRAARHAEQARSD